MHAGLPCRKNNDFLNIDMSWTLNTPENGVGNIFCGERSFTCVDRIGFFLVTFEANLAKLCFHHPRGDFGDPNATPVKIISQRFRERFDTKFGGAVHISILIDPLTRHRTNIDDMAPLFLNHGGAGKSESHKGDP